MAEREGFEPSIELYALWQISNLLPSAARPPLRRQTLLKFYVNHYRHSSFKLANGKRRNLRTDQVPLSVALYFVFLPARIRIAKAIKYEFNVSVCVHAYRRKWDKLSGQCAAD